MWSGLTAGPLRGSRGVIVCAYDNSGGGLNLLVQWDNATNGHDGEGFCGCPGGVPSYPGTGWWVDCPDVSRTPIPICPGDTNFDFITNTTDLLKLLADWGPCAGCTSDMNGDGVVNTTDLLIVLAEWGPC